MIGHLGARVSALLDGQLSQVETDRAWAHVHLCHQCRDAVEREGWVKTRLSALGGASAPSDLKGSLLLGAMLPGLPGLPGFEPEPAVGRRRHARAVIGGSAAGVAVVGMVALGLTVGADVPQPDRRAPATNISGPDVPRPLPTRGSTSARR